LYATPLLEQININVTGYEPAVVKWGLLLKVDRAIATVARAGQAIFARDDIPETSLSKVYIFNKRKSPSSVSGYRAFL